MSLENIQKRHEAIVEELDEIKRLYTFSYDQISEITRKRKDFECKIRSVTKEQKHFVDYINYETQLLKSLRKFPDRSNGSKKMAIELKIIKHIKVLYEVTLHKFNCDIDLLGAFLKFCKSVNMYNGASDILTILTKKYGDNEKLWHIASKWCIVERKDHTNGMLMLLKGISIHSSSQLLHMDMFKFELMKVSASTTLQEKEKIINKLEKIISSTYETIDSSEFLLDLLKLLEPHNFTGKINIMLTNRLIEKYFDNVQVWHGLAQGETRITYVVTEEYDGTDPKTRTSKARLQACFARYKEGLEKVSQSNKYDLWLLFINYLFELQQDSHSVATVLKRDTLRHAMQEASSEFLLPERHYIAWIDFASKDPESKVLEIAEMATDAYPHSIEIWKTRLKMQILHSTDYSPLVDQIFKKGIEALQDKSLPLWSAIIRYHCLVSEDSWVTLIYQDGIKQAEPISSKLKPQYLQWLLLNKGLNAARTVYDELAQQKPYCKEMHHEMSRLESSAVEPNYTAWGKVHRLATEQFGDEDVDVWINYLQFYTFHNVKGVDLKKCIDDILEQANARLPSVLLFDFLSKYNEMKENTDRVLDSFQEQQKQQRLKQEPQQQSDSMDVEVDKEQNETKES